MYNFLIFSLLGLQAIAQVPHITYSSPYVLSLNQSAGTIILNNNGGVVPAYIYKQVTTFAGSGASSSNNGVGTVASFDAPSGLGLDGNGNIYVCDFNSAAVRKISPGAVVSRIGSVGSPTGLISDQAGNVYISSSDDDVIYKINNAGIRNVFATGFRTPGGMCIDPNGNLIVADQRNNMIKKVAPNGAVSVIAGTGTASAVDGNSNIATFSNPDDVAMDKLGNIYVADAVNNKIRKISTTGVVSTFAGTGSVGRADGVNATFNYPTGLAVDEFNNVYVADFRNNLIRKIDPNGTVSTLAGTGNSGNVNGATLNSSFNGPIMLKFDGEGNLLVTDFKNNLLRKIELTGYTIDRALPSGLIFDGKTGIISGVPTVVSAAANYTVTAYNAFGNSSAIINISVVDPSTITFLPFQNKTVCDEDFAPDATSALPLTYTSDNLQVAQVVAGKIHIVGQGIAKITATNGISTSSQTLTVYDLEKPRIGIKVGVTGVPLFNNDVEGVSSCDGLSLTFMAVVDKAGANPSYIWKVNDQDVGNHSATFTTTELKAKDIVTCFVINNDYCMPVQSIVSGKINMISSPYSTIEVTVNVAPSGAICAGDAIDFTAKPSLNVQDNPIYQWMVNNKLIGITGPVFTSSNLNDGDQVVCVMQSGGSCVLNPIVYSEPILISINNNCEISIPNSFSPNGDGVNDTWAIKPRNINALIRIFNRSGNVVFQSDKNIKQWDGKYKGKEMPIGIYYYLIIFNNGLSKKSGSITLIR